MAYFSNITEVVSKVNSIEFDSRRVVEGGLFVAIRGAQSDGHRFIAAAEAKGAKVVVCEELPEVQSSEVEYIVVDDSHSALAYLAAQFYDNPSTKLKLVGITGTNGKTTTATLLYNLFKKLGYAVGLLSTVENRIDGEVVPSTHTTPDPVELNALLSRMVAAGCEYCFMEVSSHAMVQKRALALEFAGGVFTNLTHDHLDYHKTFANYLSAKKSFFDTLPKSAFALTNLDDRNGEVMLQNCAAKKCGYSLRRLSDYHTIVLEEHLDGTLLRINDKELWVRLIGRFNAYNISAIYGSAMELGQGSDQVLSALSELCSVDGRFETFRSDDGRLAIVDYAHTPDALSNVLSTINDICQGVQVITVVGCAGDRDKDKRPVMARIAASNSTRVILTSDNPRSEDPSVILQEMVDALSGEQLRRTLVIENREQAIAAAAAFAGKGDVILIAGKGHEKYQETKGVRTHFDDCEVIRKAFSI
ncbi:MAG: UDP-N-acetylmuramoyl-L-alanyl-D-glutamate--2,6-diaminopimelate ligase [Rikenellaceae bacterium]